MKRLVLGFIFDCAQEHVWLVHKNSPAWQAGLINGVGGKVEPDEAPLAAMARACKEVCDLAIAAADWLAFGAIDDSQAEISLFTTVYKKDMGDARQTDHEKIAWFPVTDVPHNVITNLHYLIPIARHTNLGTNTAFITLQY